MRRKDEIFRNEQLSLSKKIIEILELDENNQMILYLLDNDENKKKQIMDLIPDIRKYFSFHNIVGANLPDKIKRPYMSIIRHVTKLTHKLIRNDKMITINHNSIRTTIYTFKIKENIN